jgi:hypothetical protein
VWVRFWGCFCADEITEMHQGVVGYEGQRRVPDASVTRVSQLELFARLGRLMRANALSSVQWEENIGIWRIIGIIS